MLNNADPELACSTTTTRTQNRRTSVLDEPQNRRARRTQNRRARRTQNRRARRRQGRVASLAPRSGGLRPSLTSPARAGGSHLRRVQAPVVRPQRHRTCCPSHPSLGRRRTAGGLTGPAVPRTRRWGRRRTAGGRTPSQPEHHAELDSGETRSRRPSCGRGRSRTRCSTSASRSGGALRRDRLQHTDRRRSFRWCSSPPQLVTS